MTDKTKDTEKAKSIVDKGIAEMARRCGKDEQHCSCTGFALDFVKEDIALALSQAEKEGEIRGAERVLAKLVCPQCGGSGSYAEHGCGGDADRCANECPEQAQCQCWCSVAQLEESAQAELERIKQGI